MNKTLARWNLLDAAEAAEAVLPCCGSREWARQLVLRRPFEDEPALIAASSRIWWGLSEDDWQEAFNSHPRIGETRSQSDAGERSMRWSATEQSRSAQSDEAGKQTLADANRRYESRFGRIFIICASGKTSEEIAAVLESRMTNENGTEIGIAAEEQQKITQLRLHRWLEAND